ncbi:hypothetical protein MKX01_013531 [Papaver californicum]|nr:hypothetical protein MKX01_013531 [Papaver californicum]
MPLIRHNVCGSYTSGYNVHQRNEGQERNKTKGSSYFIDIDMCLLGYLIILLLQVNVIIGRMPVMLRSCRCVLTGKDEAELARLGECPLDPGGYFIVKGTEKVILIPEQLSKNRIIIETDKKGHLVASVTSSTEATKSKTVILMDKERIFLQLNAFPKPVPIMVVMKAIGIESDQEVVQMVGRDPRYAALLLPSIQECATENVFNQQQALEYLDKKEGRALNILRDVFLANVPVRELNLRPKCIYAAVMLRRMMDAVLNKDAIDDKDYVGNKRLELSGQLISLLFEDLFKTMNGEVKKQMDLALTKNLAMSFDNSNYLTRDNHRKGMTQVLARLSFIASPSQWGMLCPCDTPEGEACGLVKNLALMTHVTTDEEEGPLILLLSRMDSLLYLLVYPQRPLLTTRTIELVGYDKLGAGQNATVAVMSYRGYDIEDAIVMNKSSLDRGFCHCIVLKKSVAMLQKYSNNTQDRICKPDRGGIVKDKMKLFCWLAVVREHVSDGVLNEGNKIE